MKWLFILLTSLLTAREMSVSVVIPCHSKHAWHLLDALHSLENQTQKPNEVIVSLSGTTKIPYEWLKGFLDAFKKRLNLKVITHNEEKTYSQNLTIISKAATCDIISYQDADDLAHPERIERIKRYFDQYDMEVLYHSWYSYQERPKLLGFPTTRKIKKMTTGSVTLLRSLMEKVRWPTNAVRQSGVDVRFMNVLQRKSKKVYYVCDDLILYRMYLSSFTN
ncbi:MAG: glycosyltransferase [Simkaniaceae bacterium]|nr:glycosyltransferase [Simkaniaceae bacterium]